MPSLPTDQAALTRCGIDTDGAARLLAVVLSVSPAPLTRILHWMSGRPILRVHCDADGLTGLDPGLRVELDAPAGTVARWRTGRLTADGPDDLTAATTSLTWLPDRMPAQAAELLEQGRRPAGHILGPFGMTRAGSALSLDGRVKSRAVCYLDGRPVAVAAEEIPPEFCAVIAAAWERCLPGCG